MSAHCKHDSALHLLQGLRAHALRWGRAQERLPRRRPIGYFKKTKDQNAPANASYFWHGAGSASSAEERATLMSCCSLETASNRAGITHKTIQCLCGLPLCEATPAPLFGQKAEDPPQMMLWAFLDSGLTMKPLARAPCCRHSPPPLFS